MSEQSAPLSSDEILRLFKETEARFRETGVRFKETEARFRDLEATTRETSAQIRETDAQLRRAEALFGSQWGRMLEALVEPAALKLFRDRGIDVHRSFSRAKSRLNGESMEIDLLLTNDTDAVVVEVKSTLKVIDVQDFLDDLREFPRFFPHLDVAHIYGAVAGLTIDENADRYAYRQGLFVLRVTGDDLVSILNDDAFRPRDFAPPAA